VSANVRPADVRAPASDAAPEAPRPHALVPPHAPEHGDGGLLRLAEIAAGLGEDALAAEARRLAERVAEGRFYVACVGQFKRGKSTLLDALIGRAVLPADIVPVTAIPTVVRYGDTWSARIRTGNGEWRPIDVGEIARYVTETENPENTRNITAVEVFAPCTLLASGMCLVDTPGLGSVFTGNSAATRAFVPHIDAALVVLGADPPLSGDELALAEEVAAEVPDVIVVLNKADRHAGRERAAAAEFARSVLERRLGRAIGPIMEVSALEQLEKRGEPRDWPALVEALTRLSGGARASLAQDAAHRGARRLVKHLLGIVRMRRDALTRPMEESRARIAALARAARDVEQWRRDLSSVLEGDQRLLLADLEGRRLAFVADARHEAQPALERRLAGIRTRWGPALRRDAMAAAVEIARLEVTPWLAEQQAVAGAAFAERTERFRELTRALAERIASMGVPEYSGFAMDTIEEEGEGRTSFLFQPLLHVARPASPLRYVADALLAAAGGRGAILGSAHRFMDWLLELNSSRVQADVGRRLEEFRAALERAIRSRLVELGASTQRAIDRAADLRASGEDAVHAELARLARIERELGAAGALEAGDGPVEHAG